jgi:hypothetical protein
MGAHFGSEADTSVARPELLRRVTAINLSADGKHAFPGDAGYRSLQRLTVWEVDGRVVARLSLAELTPHAKYLYSDGRA